MSKKNKFKPTAFIDFAPIEDCKQPHKTYGMICIRCNKCGRFNKGEKSEKNKISKKEEDK